MQQMKKQLQCFKPTDKFLEITEIIEYCMSYHQTIHNPTVQQILDIEQWVDEIVDKRW